MKTIQNKSKEMLAIEKTYGLPIEEVLRQLYVDEALPYRAVAKRLNIHRNSAPAWLKRAGIYSGKIDI